MKRASLVLAVVACVALGAVSPAQAQSAAPSAVTPWIELEVDLIASHSVNPPRASRALAHSSRAMYLAALVGGSARDHAVAGAASTVLVHFFPDAAARIDALADALADTESAAFKAGRLVGRGLVARAQNDGANAVWTGTPPVGPGFWIPTPPAYVYPPLEPLAGTWRTWNLETGSQFRPGPPPAYGSTQFLAEMNEVYSVSRTLTEEQKRIADYWADGAGTVTPPGHWNVIALDLLRTAGWPTLRTARLFAALNTAQADAFIFCWDTKYAYWSLRPVTAIRRLLDPTWSSYIVTPPFPSYTSGHSTTSGAASTVLAAFFPGKAAALASMAEEAALSRLYGGIHYETDNEVGLTVGRRVGRVALRAYHVDASQ
jgi:membrane-associated phospholipid phosphatase